MNPIGLIKKAFKFVKKLAGKPETPKDVPFEHDDNVVLVFGHSNSGKTVYFSILYELLKGNQNFKLTPLNNETAAALIENYNIMRGKEIKIKDGRQVEVDGQRRFPTMTSETRILKFGLDLPMRKAIKFYTVDYKGETLSILEPGQLREQFAKFFPYARGALFFIDASVLETDVLLREQIAAFQTIMHDIRDCCPRTIPIGIVITKSDFLEGFSPTIPVELIPALGALHKGRSKEKFIKGLTRVNRRRFGEVWNRTTERATQTLGNLIDSITAYNLDFQFFYISATGGIDKIGDGQVEPPRNLKPVGVEAPLFWSFKRILFNKRKWFWGRIVNWVMGITLAWALFFAVLNLYHMFSVYDKLDVADKRYREGMNSENQVIDEAKATQAKNKYEYYLEHFPVDAFFGAGELVDYAKRQIENIERAFAGAGIVPSGSGSTRKGWGPATQAAREDYNKMTGDIAKLPPDEQAAAVDVQLEAFWAAHPQDSLDAGFVEKVSANHEAFKTSSGDFAGKKFELTLVVENLKENTQITLKLGSETEEDFTHYRGRGNPEKSITGKADGSVEVWYQDLDPSAPPRLHESIANPLKEFYPKLKQGVTLNFGKEYGIVIKLKSGLVPRPPTLRRI